MRSRYDDEEQPRQASAPVADDDYEDQEEYEAHPDDEDLGDENLDEGEFDDQDLADEAPGDDALADEVTAPVAPAPAPRPARPAATTATVRPKPQASRAQPPSKTVARPTTPPRPVQGSSRVSRPIAQTRARPSRIWLPIAAATVLILSVLVVLALAMNSPSPGAIITVVPTVGAGPIVASVNNAVIYQREFDERVTRDKESMLSDPLTGALLNNFEGITGTRALEVVRYDALDKLINLEVIRQEAVKEGVVPSASDQQQFVDAAKSSDLKDGKSFQQFLQEHGISEEQYRKSVLTNVIYTVMAGRHMPKTGSDDERSNGFITWFCTARKSYDVKILVPFQSANNQPCTSGLPSDIPITEIPIPGVPTTSGSPIATPSKPGAEPTGGPPIK